MPLLKSAYNVIGILTQSTIYFHHLSELICSYFQMIMFVIGTLLVMILTRTMWIWNNYQTCPKTPEYENGRPLDSCERFIQDISELPF